MVTTAQKRTSRAKAGPFTPGAKVSFKWGKDRVQAVIIADRGPLGAGGRHIYRVQLEVGPGEYTSFDVVQDEVDLAPA